LESNKFSGDIPSGFGSCSSVQNLSLGKNQLTGGLPEDIFSLGKLEDLNLQNNMFSGELNSGIGKLSNLRNLDLSSNNFSGTIPDMFGNLKRFNCLVAGSNKFTGGIPHSLSNSPTLVTLNLRNNSLGGKFELNCSAMISLVSLDVGTNKFTGLLPENLSLCKKLGNINLARNNFTGEIPKTFGDFQSLSYFSVSNCSIHNLTSALQVLQQCKNLSTLVLTLNFYDEALPTDPSLHFEKMKVLVIASCRLTGGLPSWLSNSTMLQVLDLSWNGLKGNIPPWVGDFQDLFYLDLSNNSFTGGIPRNLTQLPSLINRDVSWDGSSNIPFFVRRNYSSLQYNQIDSFPPTIELNNNFLTGEIWPEFGNLKKLHVLDLNANNLSGPIPSVLSGMASLETLALSNNNLSGTIPLSLQNLSFLSKFSVANNDLNGTIPTGGQFQTFPNSSFEGNHLCGEHRFPCEEDHGSQGLAKQSRKRRNVLIGMAVGISFGTVFILTLMFFIVLRARKRRDEVDPEKEDFDRMENDLESRLVVLFQNKDDNNSKELSIDDIMKSTGNFDQANIIGCGGFGLVYKATLPDGKNVAIKRLSGDCGQVDREFRAEVEALSRAQHPNLVHLQGYCMHKNDRLLIYSYMKNGSLDFWLHEKIDGPSSLNWDMRLKIDRGAARGLAYLHQSCEPHILHRDIKSSNILLDADFEALLADFGLARLILPYDTHVSTDLVGTLGYIPPEYSQAAVATYKGDIYSFGVVLLELLTAKRPMDMCKPKGLRDLISWVIEMKEEGREGEIFDPFIYDKQHDKELSRVLEIAYHCLSESPKVRPTTQQLVSWLDNINTDLLSL
jgi:Leucine-rich repeat (LRR) protein